MVEVRREVLKRLAVRRAAEATVLYRNGEWNGTYYLSGYAVELALKARISRAFKRSVLPDEAFVRSIYIHNHDKLLSFAGLKADLERHAIVDQEFANRWNLVKDWKVNCRYQEWAEAEARDMLDAVTNRRHGVLPWIKKRW